MSETQDGLSFEGSKPLEGIVRVSFQLNLTQADGLSKGDIIQRLAMGFDGESILERLSRVAVEHVGHEVVKPVSSVTVGDLVRPRQDIELTASLTERDGEYLVTTGSTDTGSLGTISVRLSPEDSGLVNQIADGMVELIDLDMPPLVSSLMDPETDEPFTIAARVERLQVKLSDLEKAGE